MCNRVAVLTDSLQLSLATPGTMGDNPVMPRTLRASAGGYCYHALKRGNERSRVFHDADDCHAFVASLRAGLVSRAEDWPWSSLPIWLNPPLMPWLVPGPAPRLAHGLEHVQTAHTEAELTALRRSIAPRLSPWLDGLGRAYRRATRPGIESE